MSIIQGTAKSGGGAEAASFYDYPIEQSLRFDGASRLTKSQSNSSSSWTISLWVKLSDLSGSQYLFATGTASPNNWTSIGRFSNSFQYNLNNGSGSNGVTGTALYRDTSAWYHIVVNRGSTANMWINGVLIGTESNPDAGNVNTTDPMEIGSLNNAEKFKGYLANIQLIDGQALDQYFFGEFKDNIWVPYNAFSTAGSGTATASDGDTATDSYGTNGFHLDFADSSNIGNDVSGNNNDWTVN